MTLKLFDGDEAGFGDLKEARRLFAQYSAMQMLIDDLGRGVANGLKLPESLNRRPIFTVDNVAKLLEISTQASNNFTDRFLGMGLVVETADQKRN